MSPETLFHRALEMPAGERAAFLEKTCGGDAALLQEVAALLQAHENPGSFLKKPVVNLGATAGLQSGRLDSEDRTGRSTDDTLDPRPIADGPGTAIGPYKLLQQIGEGGMGTVFMAEQTEPIQRKVALKIIKPGMDSRQVIARFEAERQALAVMDHVNIARVLDAGTTEAGLPYFVMELVQGVPITKYCDDNHLMPRERLELFVPVCQAIQHAHQKGIIHRDIKPSNVLVTLYDGRPVPKVIDFGVAKATEQKLTERTLFTQYGTMVGTFEYMSPEQAEMSALGVDTRSDIFSLGVLLYELLTGSTPLTHKRMKEAAYAEILRMIKEEEPPKPSTRLSDSGEALASISANRHTEPAKLTKLVRGELDWIVMKTLEKDRNRRYDTASAFAADVQRYLADEPVLACPPSAGYRFGKFARRNRAALTVAGLVLFFIVVLGGGGGWAVRDRAARQSEGERRARVALEEAGRFLEDEKWSEAVSFVEQAEGVLDNSGGGAELLNKARGLRQELEMAQSLEGARLKNDRMEERDLQAVVAAYAEAFAKYKLDLGRLDTQEAADRVRASPIRRQLTAALDDWAALGKAVNDDRWQCLAVARAADPDPWRNRLRDALEGKDDRALSEALQSASPESWPPPTLCQLGNLARGTPLAPRATDLLRRGQQRYPSDVWINTELAMIFRSFQPPRLEEAAHYYGIAVALRPRSPLLHANLGTVWLDQGKIDEAILAFQEAIRLNPDAAPPHHNLGAALVSQGKLEEAILAFQEAIRLDPDLVPAKQYLQGTLWPLAAFPNPKSPNPARIVMLAEKSVELMPKDGTVCLALGVAQYRAGNCPAALAALETSMPLRKGGDCADWFFMAMVHWQLGEKSKARQWYDKADQWMMTHHYQDWPRFRAEAAERLGLIQVVRSFKGHTDAIHGVALSADGGCALTGSFDGTLRQWNLGSGKEERCFTGHTALVTSVALTPDGHRALSGSYDKTVRLWDVDTGREIRRFLGHTQPVESVALSPDGRLALSGSQDKTLRVWEVATGKELHCLTGHPQSVRCASFSPDGRQALSGSFDKTMRLWDLRTGRELRQFKGHTEPIVCIAFSADGRRILSGSLDHTLRLWDAKTGEEIRRFKGHSYGIECLALSADNRRAVSGGYGTVRVWDVETGKEIYRFDGHAGGVWATVFTPDGNRVLSASGSQDGTMLLWELPQELRKVPLKEKGALRWESRSDPPPPGESGR